MISRRVLCLVLFLSVTFLFLPCSEKAFSASPNPPIKIGLLVPLSGPFVLQGTTVAKGFELYLAENNGKLGDQEIIVLKEDSEGKPDVGLTKVKKLVEKDKVDIVVGCVNSTVAFAIQKYVHTNKVPVVSPLATAEGLTKPPIASPYVFRVQVTAMQVNTPLGTWVFKNTTHRKMALIATDFAPGRDGAEAFAKGFEAVGGKIVKAVYPKVGEADFAPYLATLQEANCDAAYGWTAGADSIRLVTQYASFGLKAKMPLFGFAGLTDESVLPSEKEAALGMVVVTPYAPGYKTPENVQFVSAYQKAYKNELPSQADANGFVAAMVIDSALRAVKGNIKDKAAFLQAMGGVKLDKTPRGPIRFDQNRQVICNAFITRVEKVGNSIVNTVIDQIADVRQP